MSFENGIGSVDMRAYDDIKLHRLGGRLSLEIGGYWYQLSVEQKKQFREQLREVKLAPRGVGE